jgi:predicted house-cleaning noncanonical NTP pyrophosphatase (MazG superfamily)
MNFEPTNHPFETELPKLIRDKIPEIAKARTDKHLQTRPASNDQEFLEYLLKKLVEESKEAQVSGQHDNLSEELADVAEIIQTILKLKNLTWTDLQKIQTEKREKNGGFEKRLLMLE